MDRFAGAHFREQYGVETVVEMDIPALLHPALRAEQPLQSMIGIELLEQLALVRFKPEQVCDDGIDDHIRADGFERVIAVVNEMAEHRVHQFVRDQGKQIGRCFDVCLDEGGVIAQHSVCIDTGGGDIRVGVYGANERSHETLPAKGVADNRSGGLQGYAHGCFSPVVHRVSGKWKVKRGESRRITGRSRP